MTWNPTSTLQIQAKAKSKFSFHIFAAEPEIPILSTETSRPVYVCFKPDKRSGSCFLVAAGDENKKEIARTTYTWGLFRNPVVWIRSENDVIGIEKAPRSAEGGSAEPGENLEIIKKSIWNYTFYFQSKRWQGRFEWRYARRAERKIVGKDVNNLLVLKKIIPLPPSSNTDKKEERIRTSHFIRGEGTRTPGTKASDAGNGGRFEMCFQAADGEKITDEITVVMTCLVMLKEIDRARARQIAMISGGGGA